LLFASPQVRAETRCPPPHDAGEALAATDGRTRLEWIDQRLSREAHRMSRWRWGWAAGIGASGLGTLIAVPFVAPENRVDYYTGAVMAGLGVIPFLVAPAEVIHDGRELHAMLVATPPGPDIEVCRMLADAEERLVRDARNERLLSGWWSHAANLAINTGGFLFLGRLRHRRGGHLHPASRNDGRLGPLPARRARPLSGWVPPHPPSARPQPERFLSMSASSSPTFLRPTTSPVPKRIPNAFSMRIISFTFLSESQPATSLAVVSSRSTMSSSSKRSRKIS
jgi:hypothetical protein